MTRDQAVAHVLIWAAILGTPLLIWVGLARDTLRYADARCGLDVDRTPTPAEIADAIAIRDREESWVLLVCAECGGVDNGPCALHEDARAQEADWQSWEQEVRR